MSMRAYFVCLLLLSFIGPAFAENKCQRIFYCEKCISVPGCGWCDGKDYKTCQFVAQSKEYCSGGKDTFISSFPKGQQCPSQLFEGSTVGPKRESKTRLGLKGRAEDFTKASKIKEAVYRDVPFKDPTLSADSPPEAVVAVIKESAAMLKGGVKVDIRINLNAINNEHMKLQLKKATSIGNLIINKMMDLANNTNDDRREKCDICKICRPFYWKYFSDHKFLPPPVKCNIAFIARWNFQNLIWGPCTPCLPCAMYISKQFRYKSSDVCTPRSFAFTLHSYDWKYGGENRYRYANYGPTDYPKTKISFEIVDRKFIEFSMAPVAFMPYRVRIGKMSKFNKNKIKEIKLTSMPLIPSKLKFPKTCSDIKKSNPTAPAGRYYIYPHLESDAEFKAKKTPYSKISSGKKGAISVFCRMGEESSTPDHGPQSRKWSNGYSLGGED